MVVGGQVSFLSSPQYWSAGPGDMLEMDKERSSSMWVRGARMGGTLREAEVLLPAHNMAKRWQEMKVARLGYSSRILDVQRAWCSLDFKQEDAISALEVSAPFWILGSKPQPQHQLNLLFLQSCLLVLALYP